MPQDLIQYGALGVLAFVIYIAWDMGKRFAKVIGNHMEHDMESRDKLSKVLQELVMLVKDRLK